jgi:ABC-type antimicrobial peptide transport system permease subunit
MTIVGVVANAKWNGLDASKEQLETIIPYTQFGPSNSALIIRTVPGALISLSELQQTVKSIDAEVPISEYHSLEDTIDKSLGQRRFLLGLLTGFTALAIALSAVGLYAILAFTVSQRRREFGIRFAVGASRQDVIWMVLRHSLTMAAVGLFVGAIGAFWSGALLKSLLFGISASDTATYVAAVLLMGAVAIAASTIPAWRASVTDPATALRYE